MVNNLGEWKEEKDYSTYPKDKWCDYDTMANYIRSVEYEPKTDMENLIDMIIAQYDSEIDRNNKGYFEIEDTRINECSLNLDDYICYIEASGGIQVFDYYAGHEDFYERADSGV